MVNAGIMAKSKLNLKPRVIYWFRTDLRLHDSPALKAALDLDPECFWPIWTWDPHYVYRARVGLNRWQFLIDSQASLSSSLTKLNSSQKLLLIREAPQTLFPKLFKAWKPTHLVFEKDTDAYARERDNAIIAAAEKAGVQVITRVGRTLWDPDEVVKQNGNKSTMSITQLQAAGAQIGDIPRPIPAPTSIPNPGNTDLESIPPEPPSQSPDLQSASRSHEEKSYAALAGPNGDFAVPTLAELGFPPATTPHRGGEDMALAALEKILKDKDYIATFSKPSTAPTAFQPQATTLLSPHLHFGTLSIRELYWRVQDIVDAYEKAPTKPPTSLTGQLLFRDMYFAAQAPLGHKYAQIVGNPTCRFIPWHLQSVIDPGTGLVTGTGAYHIDSPTAEAQFQRWKYGLTGFPFIDALMRQLRQEGWIHHLGRHAVACFLTRGGCYISWERGAEVFEEWLLDHEVACNAGNWMWLSCSAFFGQFYRVYSPVAFGKKWGEEMGARFVKHFVPELGNLGDKYVFEPWKAPIRDLKDAGVRLVKLEEQEDVKAELLEKGLGAGVYPKPMLDFGEERERCIQGMKKAFEVKLYGDAKEVKDGSWVKHFDEGGVGMTGGSRFRFEEGGKDMMKGLVNGSGHANNEKRKANGRMKEEKNVFPVDDEVVPDNNDDSSRLKSLKSAKKADSSRPNGKRKTSSGHDQHQGTLDTMIKRTKR